MTVLLKGALVQYMPTFLIPMPNVIVFQYNPETMTHTWRQPDTAPAGQSTDNPIAVKGMPDESFSFKIQLDANEDIASGISPRAEVAQVSGVYTRLAALEMLLYPSGPGNSGLLGAISAAASTASSAPAAADPTKSLGGDAATTPGQADTSVTYATVPLVLFVWGAGRILPVRVTDLTINELLYNPTLSPTHAEAQLSLRVLTPAELESLKPDHPVLATLAKVAYDYTLALRQTLAATDTASPAMSIIGMLPH
jgi:hypothetical protein